LSGVVTVGESAFIGAGAVVIPGIQIGANAIVGAGAVVIKDVPAEWIVAGNPAVKIGMNK
jgi:acetyltransferase-like isoleucine patch superfamily enzyme